MRIERGKPAAGFLDHIVDQAADEFAHQFMHQAIGVEPRIGGTNRADDLARQRHRGDLVELKQTGAQPVVDVVGVIGDVVGERGDLRLDAGKAPELQILPPRILQDRSPARRCSR